MQTYKTLVSRDSLVLALTQGALLNVSGRVVDGDAQNPDELVTSIL